MKITHPQTLNSKRFIWHFLRLQKLRFTLLCLCVIMWPINETMFPWFIKLIINQLEMTSVNGENYWQQIAWPMLGAIGLWGITEIAMRCQGIISIYVFPKMRAQIRMYMFEYIKQHSPQFFSDHFAGDVAKKIDQIPDSCYKIIDITLVTFLCIFITGSIALLLLWQVNPIFSSIMSAWLLLHLIITISFGPSCHRYAENHADAKANLGGRVVDVLSNIRTVHAYGRSDYESKYLAPFQAKEVKAAQRALWQIEWMQIGLSVIATIMISSMIYGLVYFWQLGLITLGDFALISMLSLNVVGYMWMLNQTIDDFYMHVGTVNSSLQLLRAPHDIQDKANAPALTIKQGTIEFKHVDFHYGDKQILNKFDLKIPAKQKIGLVGFSGAGKSTLVNLLMRHFDIQDGLITIDDQVISDVSQQSLHRSIAMIPQDPSLFHRSLLENIRYGRLDATDEEVREAASLAHCDEFINEMPEGYDTLVGERGIKLSGGQRQRIAIARAFIKNAPIVILDEATSALDSLTEYYIQDSLQHLLQQRTCLVIAHRLSTLADMDRIIVLDQGEIIEDGSIDELLEEKGQFAELWAMQKDGVLPE